MCGQHRGLLLTWEKPSLAQLSFLLMRSLAQHKVFSQLTERHEDLCETAEDFNVDILKSCVN